MEIKYLGVVVYANEQDQHKSSDFNPLAQSGNNSFNSFSWQRLGTQFPYVECQHHHGSDFADELTRVSNLNLYLFRPTVSQICCKALGNGG